MWRFAFRSRRFFVALSTAAIIMATAVAQTRSTGQPASSQNAQSSGLQSTGIQSIPSEVDRSVDRSVHADVQRLIDGDITGEANGHGSSFRLRGQAATDMQSARTRRWPPQGTANFEQMEPASPPAPNDPTALTPTPSLFAKPPQIADPDVSGRTSVSRVMRSARTRQREEARRRQRREMRKRFLQQCSQLGLSEPECRLKLEGQMRLPMDAPSQRVADKEARPRP